MTMMMIIITITTHHHRRCVGSHFDRHHHYHHRHLHQHVDDQGMGTIQVGESSNKAVVNIAIGDGGSFGELALIYGEEDYDDDDDYEEEEDDDVGNDDNDDIRNAKSSDCEGEY